MNIERLALLDELDKLNLPKKEYAIAGSACLVIRGIKEKNKDLDVVVSKNLWDRLADSYPVNTEFFNGYQGSFITINKIDIIKDVIGFSDKERDDLIKNADIISGYRFASLEDIIKWKNILAREKDLEDIKIIKEYMSSKGE